MSTPAIGKPLPMPFATVMMSLDAVVLMGEELAAASVAALDFIENQDRVVFRTSLAESLHEFVCRQLDAAYTLYAFDNHCADISFGQFGFMASMSFNGR